MPHAITYICEVCTYVALPGRFILQAAYLISDRGFEEEAEAFLDQIFGNQGLFREGGSEDEIIENWVTASGGTFDVFNFAR